MTNGNPWVNGATSTDAHDHQKTEGEDWRRWLPSIPTPSASGLEGPIGISSATGPIAPQPHVSLPEDALPVRRVHSSPGLWVVGAHGGSGESTVAALDPSWQAAEHAWPEVATGDPVACIVVARTNVRGLMAARTALTQWAASGAGRSVKLLGLVLVADAPGRLPAPLRDLAKVVGGGSPRVWDVAWSEPWRLGEPVTERIPRTVSKTVSQLRSLAAAVVASADPSEIKEQS